jgi:hypothetical protein
MVAMRTVRNPITIVSRRVCFGERARLRPDDRAVLLDFVRLSDSRLSEIRRCLQFAESKDRSGRADVLVFAFFTRTDILLGASSDVGFRLNRAKGVPADLPAATP